MSEGWIALHRRIKDNWIWNKDSEFSKGQAWIDILLSVNHKSNKVLIGNEFYRVKPGESIRSIKTWAARWGWSRGKVKRFLDTLADDNMIKYKTDNKTTHITICNWDTYQKPREANGHQTDIKRTSNGHQTDTNNNDNNVYNNENNESIAREAVDDFVEISLDRVHRLDNPLTELELGKLLARFPEEVVRDVLVAMENHKKLTSKYTSAYLTALNWCKKRTENGQEPEQRANASAYTDYN